MNIKENYSKNKDKCTLNIDGELNILFAKELHEKLLDVANTSKTIEVSTDCDEIDITYIQIIISFDKYCKLEGKEFKYSFITNETTRVLLSNTGILGHSLFKKI
ncbi:MAG: hypothetical protein A2X12_09650 [Bacteroidetes bacterium GWE2_29_8]|nr:MAG: hypothetical protein A2X12_09650 [Bacteroidetes bacterium GWE2_29_8]OFY20083.1 MAG: hypothetical protein A2X02_06885 [Bacteroidetes bacterium GWF2_29_10]